MIKIKKITFENILLLWKEGLPNMSLEETSAMSCFKLMSLNEETEKYEQVDHYDLENQKFIPTFWGAFDDDKLIGCNSGHMTMNRLYRSRGLYVKEEYRGERIGQKLLLKTISQGYFEKAIAVWSYPRMEAWMTYHHVDFYLQGRTFSFEWDKTAGGTNTRCIRVFDHSELVKLETPQSEIKK